MARKKKTTSEAALDRQLEAAMQKEAGHGVDALAKVSDRTKSVLDDDPMLGSYVPPPPEEAMANGGAALAYARERMEVLTPLAVRELEAQMRFGTEGARVKAAETILSRAGFAAHDGAVRQGGVSPVVVQLNFNGNDTPEWLKGVTVKKS